MNEQRDSDQDRREHRLIIVDQQQLVRTGLRALLSAEQDISIVGEAKDAQEALKVCYRVKPDLVLMELHLPETDGLLATRTIKEHLQDVRVLILSGEAEPDLILAALRAGASGYLLKDAPREHLITAVRKVLEGEIALVRSIASELLQRLASDTERVAAKSLSETSHAPVTEALTSRELQVLELLALGQTNRQIARSLNIGEGTAKNHVQRIRGKLGATDRTSAAVLAIKRGILDTPDR